MEKIVGQIEIRLNVALHYAQSNSITIIIQAVVKILLDASYFRERQHNN